MVLYFFDTFILLLRLYTMEFEATKSPEERSRSRWAHVLWIGLNLFCLFIFLPLVIQKEWFHPVMAVRYMNPDLTFAGVSNLAWLLAIAHIILATGEVLERRMET